MMNETLPTDGQVDDYDIVNAMRRYGGSFVSGLGKLWFSADADNKRRLKTAFPEYWEKYAKLAKMAKDGHTQSITGEV